MGYFIVSACVVIANIDLFLVNYLPHHRFVFLANAVWSLCVAFCAYSFPSKRYTGAYIQLVSAGLQGVSACLNTSMRTMSMGVAFMHLVSGFLMWLGQRKLPESTDQVVDEEHSELSEKADSAESKV